MINAVVVASIVALLCAVPLRAQTASHALGEPFAWQVVQDEAGPTISGKVLGPAGQGLAGVLVLIREFRHGTATDGDGRFAFEAPPPGAWILTLQMIGYESVEREITVPPGMSVRVAAILVRQVGICDNACIGTSCRDLGIEVVDSITERRPEVPIRLRVHHGDHVAESLTPFDPESRVTSAWVGLGGAVETVGWHTIEILAEGYRPWRRERVWLELVPPCSGDLIGRSHRARLQRR